MKRTEFFFLLACLFPLTACQTKTSDLHPDTSKPYLPEEEYEESFVPMDDLEKKNHIMEAEAAEFVGFSVLNSKLMDTKCRAQSYLFDLSFSDSVIIRNISYSSNKYVYYFQSDRSLVCDMEVRIASAYKNGFIQRKLSEMFSISINGKYLETDCIVPLGSKEEIKQGNNYTCMKSVTLPLTIKEGKNVLIFKAGQFVSNLDYVNILTSAKITGFLPRYWEDETKIKIVLPDLEKDGKIILHCQEHDIEHSFVLPSLKIENGYHFDKETKMYSFVFAGETYQISDDGTYSFPEHVLVE